MQPTWRRAPTPRRRRRSRHPIYNWTGFYIGGHVGGAFGNDNTFNGLVAGDNSDARFLGGVQGGSDYQFAPNWVVGIEGQYSWLSSNNINAVFPATATPTTTTSAVSASITGRVGYTWGPALLYVKGGYAYSDNRETLTLGGVPQAFSFDHGHRDGYTVGAGLEYLFAPELVGQGRVPVLQLRRQPVRDPAVLAPFGSFRNDEHTVKVGINYRFNLGGPGPVVAKY